MADLGRGLSVFIGLDGLLNFILDSPKGTGDNIRFGLKLPRSILFSWDALLGLDDLLLCCKCKESVGNPPTLTPGQGTDVKPCFPEGGNVEVTFPRLQFGPSWPELLVWDILESGNGILKVRSSSKDVSL